MVAIPTILGRLRRLRCGHNFWLNAEKKSYLLIFFSLGCYLRYVFASFLISRKQIAVYSYFCLVRHVLFYSCSWCSLKLAPPQPERIMSLGMANTVSENSKTRRMDEVRNNQKNSSRNDGMNDGVLAKIVYPATLVLFE